MQYDWKAKRALLKNKVRKIPILGKLLFWVYRYLKMTFNLKRMLKTAFASARQKFNLIWQLICQSITNKKIENINLFEQKVYAREGTDGVLKIIFYKIGTINKFCVEFGVGDGSECNTRYLIEKKGWNYLHMDCGDWAYSCTNIKKEFITAENINSLFRKYNVPKEFDLLSIDIDFNDYWVWKAITGYQPRVIVIEYNASIPPIESKVVRYEPNAVWDGTNYFGASLLALVKLGRTKAYTLVGCDSIGVNAFFVRNDLINDNFVIKDIKELYKPPRYGKETNGKYIGHPPSNRYFITV